MAITPKRLYHDNPPNADTDLYTAPAGGAVALVVIAANTTGAGAALSLRVDPAGAGPARDVLSSKTIGAFDVYRLAGPIPLAAGDKLVGRNHGGTAVALLVGGYEVT